MKDPERLKDTAGGLGRSVLLASDETRPPPGAKDTVLANVLAMAAGATTLAAASTAAASTATSSGAVTSGAVTSGVVGASSGAVASTSVTAVMGGGAVVGSGSSVGVAAIGKAALLKWILVGGIGLSAAGGAVIIATSSDPPPGEDAAANKAPAANEGGAPRGVRPTELAPSPSAPAPVEPQPPEAEGDRTAAPHRVDEATPRSTQPVRPNVAPTAPASPKPPRHHADTPATPPPTPAPVASGLLEESAALGDARSMLRSGRADDALAALREMDQRFPGGALAQERTVLTVEALAATGRTKEAAAIAKKFIAAHPTSPLAGRLAPYAEP